MGTYKIEQNRQGHPKDAAGQPSQSYQSWCYRITFTPNAGENQAFPKGTGDYWMNYTKGRIAPIGPAPAGMDANDWPGSTIVDPHPNQKDNTVYMQPANNPAPVNNPDGSVSMEFCFATKTAKKAGDIELSLEYKDAGPQGAFHVIGDLGHVKVFGPLASAETLKDEEAVLTLLASYEGVKSAATAIALLSQAGGIERGFLAAGETALLRLRGGLEETAEPEPEALSAEERRLPKNRGKP